MAIHNLISFAIVQEYNLHVNSTFLFKFDGKLKQKQVVES